ncbi:ABC-2 type transport system ATP-binding protein [Gracilibacillus orientalis]|uniref:ABC-2 type transport system ATP-binding protein n=1 Tax=Gracilibacillus orientalis TaxID=334253 RepID=A0A1I4LJ38_9BACI|nr:ABC transporter ATP-binding protein [Gracilibacillus orientalis]SFL90992.1 ABC-2 type transport system ATP-binding protein [Gracilibacillus orientalis]
MTTKVRSEKEAHVIEVRQLKMRYGTVDVLKDVNFSVRRGEVLALLGPNGAGKTTTIEILEGFRISSGGEAFVLGISPKEADESWRAQLGIVMQSWRDHPKWKVHELLDHLGRYYEPYSTATRFRPMDAGELIEKVGLQEQANQKISSLSGGQRRRLDVAIGLIGNPEVLFLDEPTTGFDPQARRDFHEVIRRLSKLEDTTILLTTHDLHEAEKLSDRILILADGRIVANGSAEQLAEQVAGTSEVRWMVNNERFQREVPDAPLFVQQLFEEHGAAVTDLEVRKASLEDVYIKMVQQIKNNGRLDNKLANFEGETE